MKYEYKTHTAYRGYGWIEPLTDSEDSLIEDYLARRICEELNTLQAENEALRAEVAEWKRVAAAQAELHDEAEDCAEELAKALSGLITWFPSADTYRRLGFDPAAPMRALERAKLSLGRGGLSND